MNCAAPLVAREASEEEKVDIVEDEEFHRWQDMAARVDKVEVDARGMTVALDAAVAKRRRAPTRAIDEDM